MKLLICSLLAALLCFIPVLDISAQPRIQWQKSLGGTQDDKATAFVITYDKGYAICGYSNSNDFHVSGNHGNYDFWVVKLDASGMPEWQKCYGGSSNEYAYSICQTYDSGYVVAGSTSSADGDVLGNHGFSDYWVIKLDKQGNLVWQKCFGGTSYDEAFAVLQTVDSGYLVAGYTSSADGNVTGNHGGTDFWVLKLNRQGNISWAKCYGGSNAEIAYSVLQKNDGGYVVAGYASSNDGDVTGHHGTSGYSDSWIVSLDTSGNIIWQKSLGGTQSETAYSIKQTSDNGFIVAGNTNSNNYDVSGNHGAWDCWITKLSSSGALQWQKCLGGTSDDGAYGIYQNNDGTFLVTGYTFSNNGDVSGNHGNADYWVVKLSASGTVLWQKCYGGTQADYAYAGKPTPEGGFFIAGYALSVNGDVTGNIGGNDFWVLKLCNLSLSVVSVIPPSCIGCSDGSATISVSQGIPPYTIIWNTIPVQQGATASGLSAGTYTVTVTDSIGCTDTLMIIIHDPSNTDDLKARNNLEWYPVPAHNILYLKTKSTGSVSGGMIYVYSIYGSELLRCPITNDLTVLDISSLSSGLYVMKCSSSEGIYTFRFQKQ